MVYIRRVLYAFAYSFKLHMLHYRSYMQHCSVLKEMCHGELVGSTAVHLHMYTVRMASYSHYM